MSALSLLPFDLQRDPTILPTLHAVQSALPAQLEAITTLANAGDWRAVRQRLAHQVTAMQSVTLALVERVDHEVAEEQAQTVRLMLNGINAMKETTGGGELIIKSEQDDGQLLISASDTGVGLPPEQADQIFKAFFTTKDNGTGMGLPISRSLIESHGGRLWATGVAVQHFSSPCPPRSRRTHNSSVAPT